MDLSKLFETQKELDAHIVKEKGLEGQDLLDKKILALQVELGELANEWRGFKFWSEDQEPKQDVRRSCLPKDADYFFCGICHTKHYDIDELKEYVNDHRECPNEGCNNLLMPFKECDPLLEEYVDCLHFILSIGLDEGFEKKNLNLAAVEGLKRVNITKQLNYLFEKIGDFSGIRNLNNYVYIIPMFMGLGEMLGFTWEQIEQAYFDKNKINYERQLHGY